MKKKVVDLKLGPSLRGSRISVMGNLHTVKVFDNGGATFDRYTVFYEKEVAPNGNVYWPYIGMSENPFHPQGFGQHDSSKIKPTAGGGLGKKIEFSELPPDCKRAVILDCMKFTGGYQDFLFWKMFKDKNGLPDHGPILAY